MGEALNKMDLHVLATRSDNAMGWEVFPYHHKQAAMDRCTMVHMAL